MVPCHRAEKIEWHLILQKHYFLGLKILNMLVAEFNQPIPGRTLTQHRKLAVTFRDSSLFSIFELALVAMRQLMSSAVADNDLREQVPFVSSCFHAKPCLLYPLSVAVSRLVYPANLAA